MLLGYMDWGLALKGVALFLLVRGLLLLYDALEKDRIEQKKRDDKPP